jgi:peptide-methionine (R)-S-oxide reductase
VGERRRVPPRPAVAPFRIVLRERPGACCPVACKRGGALSPTSSPGGARPPPPPAWPNRHRPRLRPARQSSSSPDKVVNSEREWRGQLPHGEYRALRGSSTERPWTGRHGKFYPRAGPLACKASGAPLHAAGAKLDAGSGWLAFAVDGPGAVTRKRDVGALGARAGVASRRCDSHFGHLFDGERLADGDAGHCMKLGLPHARAGRGGDCA